MIWTGNPKNGKYGFFFPHKLKNGLFEVQHEPIAAPSLFHCYQKFKNNS
jgi:hypothetical protein